MKTIKIAIIRENKKPQDRRTPITPLQAAQIQREYPQVKIVVQNSETRCYSDNEYQQQGIQVVDQVDDCDVLFGVKEVPLKNLIPGKTYFFFSHTIKKQAYNRELLREILKRNIRMVDYECLVDEKGIRIIAFGRWAGIVGTYNAFWTYGKKYKLFDLKRAYECKDLNELKREISNISLPPVKIIITGNGRVAKGGLEVLKLAGIKQVEPAPFFYQTFEEPVFTQTDVNTYYRHKKGHPFDFHHFFKNPEQYVSDFVPFTHKADVLINAVFWDPKAPRLFSLEDMQSPDFQVKVIADITCDIEGSIPSTIRASNIDDPVYDFDPHTGKEKPAFSDEKNISVMAIDTLPNELPRDSSEDFGQQLLENVLPALFGNDKSSVIKKATIADGGKLTERFGYLKDFVELGLDALF